jgi:hypothetical protein
MLEKAIQIGVIQAIRDGLEKDRYYELYGFSYGHDRYKNDPDRFRDSFPNVASIQNFEDHVKWMGECMNGGTDFDDAFELLIQRLTAIHEMGIEGCDVTFWSDGICEVDDDTINRWNEIKSLLDVRLMYFQFGDYPNEQMFDLADVSFRLPDLWQNSHEEIISMVAEAVTEHFFTSGD